MAILVGVTVAIVVALLLLFVGALWAVNQKNKDERGH